MTREELISRTQQFALRIIHLCERLMGKGGAARVLARPLLRSGTSVGANDRAACIKTKRHNIVD